MNSHLTRQVNQWIANDPDSQTREYLQALLTSNNEAELASLFAGRLDFGTAGIRGVVGAGPMRMNRLLVRQTTAGLGQYLAAQVSDAKRRGVIIGYDGRNDSKQFAQDTAAVLLAMGYQVKLTYQVAPTPLVAFGVKHFNCAAGIVVTASHNPPQYNGYKVYWDNGAQIITPHDTGIAACIQSKSTDIIKLMPLNDGLASGQLQRLEQDYYDIYQQAVLNAPELNASELKSSGHASLRPELVSMSYTAMHGVGAPMAEAILAQAGFTQVYSVAAQRLPDGNFPTVAFPNPEEPGAMDLVIAEAKAHQALLACANDPDADRFAVAVRKDNDGGESDYQMLSGDQVGILLGHYLLTHAKHLSQKDGEGALVGNTIVSSSLLAKIADSMGATSFTTLTGFKWLMNVAQQRQTQKQPFLFAYEEALGYTVGSTVWDKDGLSAQLAFAQLTAELTRQGQTIWDRLSEIYRQFGLHFNAQISIKLEPNTPNIGEGLRAKPPLKIGDASVISIDDIKVGIRTLADGSQQTIDLPSSDVLIYRLDNASRVIVRPSGTEPKIKCYYEVITAMGSDESLEKANIRAKAQMDSFIQAHQASLPKG
ncbi:phospho-sugar mutase [Shewanella sp. SNU WT4]|uniref:phospho-sugar mutase n=1 Tax=Shewanella sp. SNU WT4 TaxID=2590015 RepID=UPI0011271130|nr:phospho-sugar mutase [Shewanella sp. SNU WT4]QDF68484.1 phospho-sugar mutase [Shewanella sp. SNU WT4]